MRKQIIGTTIVAGALALFATAATAAAAATATTTPGSPRSAAVAPAETVGRAAQRAAAGGVVPHAVPSGSDRDQLQAMTAALKTMPHTVIMRTQGSSTTGSVDPVDHAANAVAKTTGLEIDEVVKGGAVYVKADLGDQLNSQFGITPNVWMKMDPHQIGTDNALLLQPDGSDPVDMAGIENGMTSLHAVDPQHLEGTLNLTKITGHTVPNPDEVSKAGAAATAVPFAVTADKSGRIVEFNVDADAFDPSLSLDVRYAGYGTPQQITVPSAVPAPASLYSVFNN